MWPWHVLGLDTGTARDASGPSSAEFSHCAAATQARHASHGAQAIQQGDVLSRRDGLRTFSDRIVDIRSLEATTYSVELEQASDASTASTGQIKWDEFKPGNGQPGKRQPVTRMALWRPWRICPSYCSARSVACTAATLRRLERSRGRWCCGPAQRESSAAAWLAAGFALRLRSRAWRSTPRKSGRWRPPFNRWTRCRTKVAWQQPRPSFAA